MNNYRGIREDWSCCSYYDVRYAQNNSCFVRSIYNNIYAYLYNSPTVKAEERSGYQINIQTTIQQTQQMEEYKRKTQETNGNIKYIGDGRLNLGQRTSLII